MSMDKWMDYYSILQVHCDADPEVVEATYRRLSKKYHPDVNSGDDATRRMQEINVAYDVLRDPEKRQVYHRQWAAQNRAGGASAPVFDATGYDDARRVITQYFECITASLYAEAYRVLSPTDRKHNPESAFVLWQQAVSRLYRIDSFQLGASRYFGQFELDSRAVRARRFTVHIRETNLETGDVSEYSHVKFAVQEGSSWRVYLGYTDIASCARGMLERVPGAGAALESEGVLSRRALMERLDQEIYRKTRYKRPLSIGVIRVSLESNEGGALGVVDRCARTAVARRLRLTDAMGRCGSGMYVVLFGETPLSGAKRVVPRLCERLSAEMAKAGFKAAVRGAAADYETGSAEQFLQSAAARLI